MVKYTFEVYVKNIGIYKFSSLKNDINKAVSTKYFIAGFTRFLKKYNLSSLQYINNNIQKLELCGFCNKNFAKYTYNFCVENNQLKIINIKLFNNQYICTNINCKNQRKKLYVNSFEHIAKRKKISLEQANQWQKAHNKSPFYFHEGQSREEYSKRQSRGYDFYIKRYGQTEGQIRWKNYCKKISIANKKQNVIKKYGEQYNKKLQDSKKRTLENFIKQYGVDLGKEKYKNWISSCTKIGMYFNNKRIINSKQAYNFFQLLEKKLIDENICKKEDILYNDGNRTEYKLDYINNQNKFRWYYLDFVILKYKIDIEFNGSTWHYNIDNEEKNQRVIFNKSKQYQLQREKIIKENGFYIIKIWDYQITNNILCTEKIIKICNEIKNLFFYN